MEIKKGKLLLVKEALQYGIANSKSESKDAEFTFLLMDVESAILEEQNPKKEEPPKASFFLDKLTVAARKMERAKLAREAMLVLLGQDQTYWLVQKEKLITEAYSVADAYLDAFDLENKEKSL